MNMVMHGTESTYMETPMARTTARARGIVEPSAYSASSRPVWMTKTGTRPRMPTRESSTPESMLEMMHITP